MKKLLLSASLAAVLMAPLAAKAQYQLGPSASGLVFTNLAQAATNVAAVIDVRGSQFVSFQIISTNDAAATDNLGFVFYRSLDGVNFETAAVANIQLAEAGTTAIKVVTNIPVFSAGWLKLGYVTNAAATANAVITLKYSQKKGI